VSGVAARIPNQLTAGSPSDLASVKSTAAKYSSQGDLERALSTLSIQLPSAKTFNDRPAASSQLEGLLRVRAETIHSRAGPNYPDSYARETAAMPRRTQFALGAKRPSLARAEVRMLGE
jgi:hypothetical protein